MGLEDRIERLEQDLGNDVGQPPQVYIDARNRRTRYMRLGLSKGLGAELTEEERTFMQSYRDSELKDEDSRIIRRYASPVSPEKSARAREKMKEYLDAIAARRRELGI